MPTEQVDPQPDDVNSYAKVLIARCRLGRYYLLNERSVGRAVSAIVRVLSPEGKASTEPIRLAPRPDSLDGLTVGFLDGWGHHKGGEVVMHPFLAAVRDHIQRTAVGARAVWLKKPDISRDAPEVQFARLFNEADVVVNGECA